MNQPIDTDAVTGEGLAQIEERVQCRMNGRVHNFRLRIKDDGLVLTGLARTYHAKQLAQHAVMEATNLPIRANEIEVR